MRQPEPEIQLSDPAFKLLLAAAGEPAFSADTAVEWCGRNRGSTHHLLDELIDHKLLKKNRAGKYTVTKKGEEHAGYEP